MTAGTHRKFIYYLWLVCLPWVGCTETATQEAAPASTWFPLRVGEHAIEAQLAVRPAEMQRGLMYRREMGENRGMLFVYERPQQLSFWMRNTVIPLDIGFFDPGGRLLEVRQMEPHDETPVPSRSSNVQYALEMNQGWFASSGVEHGARLDMEAVSEALEQRGFETGRYLENE